MDRETIHKIIEAANKAPSGSNSQPWQFIVYPNRLLVKALPGEDHPILNFRNRGTHVAHGAMIENIDIASRHFGYEPSFNLFPSEGVSVEVKFEKKATDDKGLFEAIHERHSNRKPYKPHKLTDEINFLLAEASRFQECDVLIAEGDKIAQAAQHLPYDMTIFLQNKKLHNLLFKEILWDENEQKTRRGLYVGTLEASGGKATAMKLLKNWRLAKIFRKLKVPKKIHQEGAKTASTASVILGIAVRNDDSAFIHAGRLMENIWLRATKLGLSFHLMSGVAFLWQQLNYGDRSLFSEEDRKIIDDAYLNLTKVFGVNEKIIALIFRIGKADAPLATSFKRPPRVEWRD